jgi:hypothetical protein
MRLPVKLTPDKTPSVVDLAPKKIVDVASDTFVILWSF